MQLEERTDKTIVPFSFQGLKKLSRRDLEMEAALLNFLPFVSQENVVKKSMEEFLARQFNLETALQLEKFEEGNFADFLQMVPDPCLVAVLGVQPVPLKAFAWIDSVLAATLIDRVLGGSGDLPADLRPPTPIEEGVFQYLVLKAIGQIYQACGESAAVHFRLEKIAKSQKELIPLGPEETPMVLLNFRVKVGPTLGFVVVALPHPLIEALFLSRQPLEHPDRLQEYEYSVRRFDQMGHVRTPLWVEIGAVSLTLSEKNQLEKGDVILFDQTNCQMMAGHLGGNVIVRIGEGKGGGFLAQVVSAEAPALVKILDYYGGE